MSSEESCSSFEVVETIETVETVERREVTETAVMMESRIETQSDTTQSRTQQRQLPTCLLDKGMSH